MIGAPVDREGLISFPVKQLGLCISLTNAMYATTTEVIRTVRLPRKNVIGAGCC